MKANKNTVGQAADADDSPDKRSEPGTPRSSAFFQADKYDQPPVSATQDAEAGTEPFTFAILGLGAYPNKVSDDFEDDDVPEENLF